jgi:predicted DNA-binding transcriptional regulator AlpA
MPSSPALLRIGEIARLLGVTHQRATQRAAEPDFPAPAARVGRRRLWNSADVEAWARIWRTARPWRGSP